MPGALPSSHTQPPGSTLLWTTTRISDPFSLTLPTDVEESGDGASGKVGKGGKGVKRVKGVKGCRMMMEVLMMMLLVHLAKGAEGGKLLCHSLSHLNQKAAQTCG